MSQRHLSSVSILEQSLLAAAALALVAMLSLPAARGVSEVFGWLPFWLLALPLAAWATARLLRRRAAAAAERPIASVHRLRTTVRPATAAQLLRRAA